MRKGFTLVEILVVLAIIAIVASLIFGAISAVTQERQNQAGLTSPASERLEVVDGPLEIGSSNIYILRDKQTEVEFVYATDNFDYGTLMSLRGSNER